MDRITLAHGSGGRPMHKLIDSLFIKDFANDILAQKKDSAVFNIGKSTVAFTTDSYVVNPIFFPGGDIGSLAIYGTVNDLSVCGARPLCVSLGMIIEDGLAGDVLRRITRSIKKASDRSGVKVVTGDTKVVEKGACDKIFINTSGIGEVYYEGLSIDMIRPGDILISSGPVGSHAISILSEREGVAFKSAVKSDSAPLNRLIQKALKASRKVRFMRDPTRGGLASTLNEIAFGRRFGIELNESDIPVAEGVRSACELLGLDPLCLACEGTVVLVVAEGDAVKVLKAVRSDESGASARAIGKISSEHKGMVYLKTSSGGKRIIDMPSGEELPRIC